MSATDASTDTIGLGNLISALLRDVGEAMAEARSQQLRQSLELAAILQESVDVFARRLPPEELEQALIDWFPAGDADGSSAIKLDSRLPNTSSNPQEAVVPMVFSRLGLKLAVVEFKPEMQATPNAPGAIRLTQAGVDRIREATRLTLAAQELEVLRRQGSMPGVTIESGRLLTKLIFSFNADAQRNTAPAPTPAPSSTPMPAPSSTTAGAPVASASATGSSTSAQGGTAKSGSSSPTAPTTASSAATTAGSTASPAVVSATTTGTSAPAAAPNGSASSNVAGQAGASTRPAQRLMVRMASDSDRSQSNLSGSLIGELELHFRSRS